VRPEGAHLAVAHIPGADFAVHAQLAHAAGDELGVLRTEVEDQDAVRMDVGVCAAGVGSAGRSWNARHGMKGSGHPVVGGVLGDADVVHVTLADAGGGDAHEHRARAHVGDVAAAGVAHGRPQSARQLAQDGDHAALVGNAALHTLRYQLLELGGRVLEITIRRAVAFAHRPERAHAAVRLVGRALVQLDFAGGFLGAGDHLAVCPLRLDALHRVEHAPGMPVRGVHDHHVDARFGEGRDPIEGVRGGADRSSYAQAAALVLAGARKLVGLLEVLHRDHADQLVLAVHHQALLDTVP